MLPKLYSLRSDGKTQVWWIEVKDDSYRMNSGILDGEIVTSEWTKCTVKNSGRANQTSPKQQAETEARSAWKKKCDSGYKEDIKDIHDVGFFEPMLAHKYGDYAPLDFPIWTQPKLDGARCIVRSDGMWSRKGKPVVSAPHIFEALKPLFKKNPNLIFDGELYADKLSDDFEKIISLAKKTKPTEEDLAESAKELQYHVYDLPSCKDIFGVRSAELKKLVKSISDPSIIFVETVLASSQEELDNLYGKWIEDGYEGQMVRLDAVYENKRTSSLLKRKEFIDEEYTIEDVEEGIGNRSGMAGKLVFKTAGGSTFRAGIKGKFSYFRKLLAEKKKIIGKMATVKYQNLTGDGIPRFPVCTKIDAKI